jgi:DNA-binding transcriptional regulator YiaG
MAEVGRPTEYGPELLKKAQEYLANCKDETAQIVKQANSEKGYEMYENKLKVKLPSIEGLARFLNVSRSTLYEWEKEYPEFSDILEAIKAEQAERLINNGLSGDYNSTIAKLILTKHGYSDKTETDITSKGKQVKSSVINIIKPDGIELSPQPEAIPGVAVPDGSDND